MTDSSSPLAPEEFIKRIKLLPATLNWVNFSSEQPGLNRYFVMWCNFGPLTPNLYMCYRDNLGQYQLPEPYKQYPIQAWAYIEAPEADPKSLEDAQLADQAVRENEGTSES